MICGEVETWIKLRQFVTRKKVLQLVVKTQGSGCEVEEEDSFIVFNILNELKNNSKKLKIYKAY